MRPPSYFDGIRQSALQRWQQLEQDGDLAAPWYQLFKQVQSPRHVVSELLQNADDAGATEAFVRIEDGAFVFQHNGDDFTEEQFASLCRFGYSNKRSLHTIGFRGIGFKSTFSLGDTVELYTPTLSVSYDRNRFTQPRWTDDRPLDDGLTTVRVAIRDEIRRRDLENNLEDWLQSPASLLFFKHIRRIRFGDDEVHWGSLGDGPVSNSEWLALHEDPDRALLLVRSEPEAFPAEALAEIMEERLLRDGEDVDFPPSVVEIVLGLEGYLFVVLPTGVKTELPFACNAPFIQDPGRMKIKDPGTSPTNRWLLERAGKLAAQAMDSWLKRGGLPAVERARAYDLMPDIERGSSSLEQSCATIVEEAFASGIDDDTILLTENGQLVASKAAIVVPRAVNDVWPGEQATTLIDDEGRPSLSLDVSDRNRSKLVNWGLMSEIDDDGVLDALRARHMPRPRSWRQLMRLWTYLEPSVTSWRYHEPTSDLRILPAQGKGVLFAADEIVRIGEKKLLPSEEDWGFLGDRLSVLNQNWLRFLTEQRRLAETNDDDQLSEEVHAAEAVLEEIGLDTPSDTGKVIGQVAEDFFSQEQVPQADAIRLAQIAAKLGAGSGNRLRFVTADGNIRPSEDDVLFDEDGLLEFLLPEEWAERHLLHPSYSRFRSCTREEWKTWVSRRQSGPKLFVPLEEGTRNWVPRSEVEATLRQRAFEHEFEPTYSNPSFQMNDWDFPEEIWDHWATIAQDDSTVWGKVVERLLTTPDWCWSGGASATVTEVAQNGHTRLVVREGLLPSWILKLRDKPCLRDTHGTYRKPGNLLRLTPLTRALIDVEPFVHEQLDTEAAGPLLKLLGVGEVPTGPWKLIQRLRALAEADSPPLHEVEKWYRRLDTLFDGSSTEDVNEIRRTFSQERLILTEHDTWETVVGVFLSADEDDAPGAETVRRSVKDLTLWRKLGVADRPTADLALDWLKTLPSGDVLSQVDARRARALMARYPARVWVECAHWINLAGEWAPTSELRYAWSLHPPVPWAHLHQWVKRKTADLRSLPIEICQEAPFAALLLLAEHMQEELDDDGQSYGIGEERPWLKQLGTEIGRIKFDDEEETKRISALAADLAVTTWLTKPRLRTLTYIDGKPAGTPRPVDVVWANRRLFAEDRPITKLARPLAEELERSFRRTELVDAIKFCIERPPTFVTDYFEENFELSPPELVDTAKLGGAVETDITGTDAQVRSDVGGPGHPTDADQSDDGGNGEAGDFPASAVDNETTAPDIAVGLENDEEEATDSVVVTPPSHPRPKPARPDIMERFAKSQGFAVNGQGIFVDGEGNSIVRANGGLFPWERRSAAGDLVKQYWPRDHCLDREPLELGADVWNVVVERSETCALVLSDPDGRAIEISGGVLADMSASGDLVLHPATYRLERKNSS